MRPEEPIRTEIHDALDPLVRPAPGLAAKAMERVHAEARPPVGGGRFRGLVQAAAVLGSAAVLTIAVVAIHQATHHGPSPVQTTGPFVAPVTTGSGAQIAWLEGQTGIIGVDPSGHIVGTIQLSAAVRSTDGSEIYALSDSGVEIYSAVTGKLERTIVRQTSGAGGLTVQGRYLAILTDKPAGVELVDLIAGRSVASARLGNSFPTATPEFLMVSSDGSQLFAFAGFWQHTAVAALQFNGTSLQLTRQVIDGQQGHTVPSCDGMASANSLSGLPERLMPDGKTMVSFCPGDGVVSWFDLDRLTITARVRIEERNPFWLSPVFARDGSMLYVQEPGTGRLTVVDLQRRAIVRSAIVNAPTAFNPLQWVADRLFPPAFAGGIPRTAAISPDGTSLYVTGGFDRPIGIGAVRLSDFHVSGQWSLDGGGSLWLSGDGGMVYVLNNGGDQLSILHLDSSSVTTVKLSPPGYDFLALPN